ncbi:unnamed protein product, partial [Effrenium voratum]
MSCLARLPLHSADSRDIGSGMAGRRSAHLRYNHHGQSSDLERPFIPDPPYALAPPTRAGPMARPSTWRIFLPAFGISVAGSWTGVMQFADLPAQAISVPGLADYYQQSRLQLSRTRTYACHLPALVEANASNQYGDNHKLRSFDPVAQEKSIWLPMSSAGLYSDGFDNYDAFRACTMPSKLEAKALRTNSTGPSSGMRYYTHRAFSPLSANGSPPHLPLYAPSLDLMHNIYNDFRYNFRSFESWNLRQKSKCNQARLQQHHHRIFKAIKPAMREPMDRLVEKHTVAILAVSADGTQIHTDASLESRPHATWWVDGTPATVKQLSQDTFEVESDLLLVKGQQLHQHHHLSSESQIHSTLEQFWQKRWSKHADLPQEAWKRIFGFVKAYVPKGAIETFLDMFQLSIDLDKTYLWAVHPRDRQQLGLLKHRTSLKDKDLGGHMTYGPRRRDFSLQLIKQLRTAAVRALGHGNAGASPAIRLSLLQGNIL